MCKLLALIPSATILVAILPMLGRTIEALNASGAGIA